MNCPSLMYVAPSCRDAITRGGRGVESGGKTCQHDFRTDVERKIGKKKEPEGKAIRRERKRRGGTVTAILFSRILNRCRL